MTNYLKNTIYNVNRALISKNQKDEETTYFFYTDSFTFYNNFIVYSQNNNSALNDNSAKSATVTTEKEKKYEIEKGFIKYKINVMGLDIEVNKYFMEYGQLESTRSITETLGQKAVNTTLQKEGYLYSYSNRNKKGIKFKIDNDESDPENSTPKYDEATIKQLGGKELGQEYLLNKNCLVLELEQNDGKSKFWLWKNILLKMAASQHGMEVIMEAIEFSESPDFPDGIFELPDNIEFVDQNEELYEETEESD